MSTSLHPHGSLALVNARLNGPVAGTETRGGVLVEQGFIRQVGPDVTASSLEVRTIDGRGDVVAPGLVEGRRAADQIGFKSAIASSVNSMSPSQ